MLYKLVDFDSVDEPGSSSTRDGSDYNYDRLKEKIDRLKNKKFSLADAMKKSNMSLS